MNKFKYLNEVLFIAFIVMLANLFYGTTINVLFLLFAGCILTLVAVNKLIKKMFNIKLEHF